nr:hypothetical protein [Tanacetum cinerariifolium]
TIYCLPNEEIFTELSRMGCEKPSTKHIFYKAFFSPQWKFLIHTILQCMSVKRTSWNVFSYSMASAVICLSAGRKFNFSKAQVGDLSSHSIKYSSPALTQKVFANIRRVGKRFYGVDTPLFEGMIVAQQDDDVADEGATSVAVDDVPAAADEPSIPSPTPTTQPPPSYDLPSTSQGRQAKSQAQIYQIDLEHADKVLSMLDDEVEPAELQEVVEVVTTAKLKTEVVTAASATITATTTLIHAATITAAPSATRRRKGVLIIDPKETVTPSIIIHLEPKSKDKGKGILVEEPKPLKKMMQLIKSKKKEKEDNVMMRYQALKRKPQTEAQARKNMMIYLRNMAGFKMEYFKGMSYDDIHLIFEKYFNSNVAFLEKTKEQMEEEDSRALKRANESQAKKVVKKQKLDEEREDIHLQDYWNKVLLLVEDDEMTKPLIGGLDVALDPRVEKIDWGIRANEGSRWEDGGASRGLEASPHSYKRRPHLTEQSI